MFVHWQVELLSLNIIVDIIVVTVGSVVRKVDSDATAIIRLYSQDLTTAKDQGVYLERRNYWVTSWLVKQ